MSALVLTGVFVVQERRQPVVADDREHGLTEAADLPLTEHAAAVQRCQPRADLVRCERLGGGRGGVGRRGRGLRGDGGRRGRGRRRGGRLGGGRLGRRGGVEGGLQGRVLVGQAFDLGGQLIDLDPELLALVEEGRIVLVVVAVRRAVGQLVLRRLELGIQLDAGLDRRIAFAQGEIPLALRVAATARRTHPQQAEHDCDDGGHDRERRQHRLGTSGVGGRCRRGWGRGRERGWIGHLGQS